MHFEPAIAAPGEPTSLAWSFAFVEGQLLMREGDDALAPGPAHDAPERHYMGRLDGIDAWALRLESAPPGWQRVPLRAAMMAMAAPHMSLASRAAQLIEWDRTHRHCGVCGTPTELMAHERARRCPACGHLAYPRVTPAMMVLVAGPRAVRRVAQWFALVPARHGRHRVADGQEHGERQQQRRLAHRLAAVDGVGAVGGSAVEQRTCGSAPGSRWRWGSCRCWGRASAACRSAGATALPSSASPCPG
jgi:DNA-directed RNA polymerase subunit RPC12/RpoP